MFGFVERVEADLTRFRSKLAALDGVNGDMSHQRSHYWRLIRECEAILRWYPSLALGDRPPRRARRVSISEELQMAELTEGW
ncbi:hypothetical protein I6F35_28080 [Bradyrhizobium sp. BRP22]|uniref:hypothetical protein n=1 Tax=Bradyrhizobium sp. BRP22 TaxID=2793821 RepID=UPI001CD738DE|nr:hypothetical protein [Bradyrhizobium sp. BRP22]MCA1457033.1 hypothetical protein [Bradyrhizobium sp. BRP22]